MIRLTPRAGRDAIDGVDEAGRLRIRVAAAPVDGAANESLMRLLARALGVPPSTVYLESGAASRRKCLRIDGVTTDDIAARWPGIVIR